MNSVAEGLTGGLRGVLFNEMVKQMSASAYLDRTFGALADPTRRAILARLSQGEASVTQLRKPLKVSFPAISKHLKVLQQAGLIERRRQAQWRLCTLTARPLKDAVEWLERYRRFWEESFDRLDKYLKELKRKEKTRGRQK